MSAAAGGSRGSVGTAILFVCTGNICRSPVAAELWRMRSPHLTSSLSSAGTAAVRDGRVPEVLQQLMRLEGGGVSGHRGRQLESSMIADADLILTMTKEQRRWVARHSPMAVRRTYTLLELTRLTRVIGPRDLPPRSEDPELAELFRLAERQRRVQLDTTADDDIPDPYGRSKRVHRAVLRQLDTAISALTSRVESDRR